jgi:hypothetical protein
VLCRDGRASQLPGAGPQSCADIAGRPGQRSAFCRPDHTGDPIDRARARAHLVYWQLDDEFDDPAEDAYAFVRTSWACRRIRSHTRCWVYEALSGQQIAELVR